jgi:hypothetical protein
MSWLSDIFKQDAPPDPNQAAIAGAVADMENYPFEYQINSLAKMGGKATINGKLYDFTGLGDADTTAAMSDKMAQTLLDLQKQYGPDFIKQKLAELKAADPTGYAARQQLFDQIMADADASPDRPMNNRLQAMVQEELAKGGKLDSRQTEQVQQGVRGKQLRQGIFLGNAATSEEAGAVVSAGEAERTKRQQQGIGILNSGVLPEDVQYRQIQQSLSNLGNFTSGASPTNQFQSLSSASNGAVPFQTGATNQAQLNPNATQMGMGNALDLYSQQQNWANSQVNPWMAGISGGIAGYNLGQKAGWGNSGATGGATSSNAYGNYAISPSGAWSVNRTPGQQAQYDSIASQYQ